MKYISNIKENFSLKDFNTFGFDVLCDFFVEIKNLEDLNDALDFADSKNIGLDKILFLGGGSNILLTERFEGLVIKNGMLGIPDISPPSGDTSLLKKTPSSSPLSRGELQSLLENKILVKCNGGEVWDDFVAWTLEEDLFGLENLSLIPGVVGTCPIQNIGAYGVEVKDVVFEVEVLDLKTRKVKFLKNSECEFGYRDSYFKRNKQKYFILSVTFELSKKFIPHLKYGIIKSELEKKNILEENITGKDVRNAVIGIRESKLPNPKILGNSGSFFKNPVVEETILENIQKYFQDVPSFEVFYNNAPRHFVSLLRSPLNSRGGDNLNRKYYKIPAGWLIEKAGFKGRKFGKVGVHAKQSLVLINLGGGTGKEILELAQRIQKKVQERFGIKLEMEVNIL